MFKLFTKREKEKEFEIIKKATLMTVKDLQTTQDMIHALVAILRLYNSLYVLPPNLQEVYELHMESLGDSFFKLAESTVMYIQEVDLHSEEIMELKKTTKKAYEELKEARDEEREAYNRRMGRH